MSVAKENLIECPKCGHRFAVSEALSRRVEREMEARLKAGFDERLKNAIRNAEARAREGLNVELEDLRARLAEEQRKTKQAEQQELALRKKARELEDKQQKLDLELERRLEEGRRALAEKLREEFDEAHSLKLKEKEQQIEDLRKMLEEAKRKSQQGSPERQGEVLELNVEAVLNEQFPGDAIRAVPKGVRGADLIQEVRNSAGQPCGSILWEVKNTRHFQPAWIGKLKQDQRAIGAALAVIVTVALPEGIREFGRVDGVWIASLRAWPALATALREQLLQVAFARAAWEGKREKMELLYAYLSGDEFRQRVEAIVEAFSAMQSQLQKERRAVERLWQEREKQIQKLMINTAGMYGDIRGLIGAGMPEVRLLALEAASEESIEP
ncbi:MAG TPA: DUF2130 domain-containing protein [Terriglobia bacterium]|nr:DUF2130 domain-containing protein [Terriglobia bacterium]